MGKILLQAVKFYGISGIGWLIDFGVFAVLNAVGVPSGIGNMISSLCGVTFVFFLSTRKTFKVNQSRLGLKQKYLIYVLVEILVILAASKGVSVLTGLYEGIPVGIIEKYAAIFAKICVTPFTMLFNFIFMKILTEKV